MLTVTQKWRPPLALVISLVCIALVTLPIIGVLGARLSSNQFARETERSLLSQAVIFGEIYATAFSEIQAAPDVGHSLSTEQMERLTQDFHPIPASLDLFRGQVSPPRPDPVSSDEPLDAPYSEISQSLSQLARSAKKTTLSGYVFMDHSGRIIASSGSASGSFLHVPEVSQALEGETVSLLRQRDDTSNRHLLNSISRDTLYRVFVAHPVVLNDRVIGAVYLSRTPMDLRKFLFQERFTLGSVVVFMLVSAAVVGWMMWRLISKPIRDLSCQSQDVASGLKPIPDPVQHYGVKELAELGNNVVSMAATLSERSTAIETYTSHVTHELKSPVTAILGAAELLSDGPSAVSGDRNQKLVHNIQQEGLRMNALLSRLRELARASIRTDPTPTLLADMVQAASAAFSEKVVELQAPPETYLPLSKDQGHIVLHHLLQNAFQHGATRVDISFDAASNSLIVSDNGSGICPRNSARITEPFFTTRRDQGGTGLGLSIVTAVLKQAGVAIETMTPKQGASFRIKF
ncbi:ATP-binding protein [Ruegeria sp. Alg231-54]|uniref:ATP-binding protein n=1 Tax=Ruegeria sp. Alg231-54 TaxID=1922221 RepID=UPI000D552797|nr:ATP-binding protein [Ruegeria sp. Alg231-54]